MAFCNRSFRARIRSLFYPNEPQKKTPPYLNVKTKKTAWVFLSASNEARHLYDIVYGAETLRKRGVPLSDMYFFSDHPAAAAHFKEFGISANIFHPDEIEGVLGSLPPHELAALVVTGHGSEEGIITNSQKTLTPEHLISALRKIAGIEGASLILCQCFGGIFNYTHVADSPSICIIGATNLHQSLSVPVSIKLSTLSGVSIDGWTANVFLISFFVWLDSPKDVDGDGQCSLIDAYRYAGAQTNSRLRKTKADMTYMTTQTIAEMQKKELEINREWDDLVKDGLDPNIPIETLEPTFRNRVIQFCEKHLLHSTEKKDLEAKLDILHLHQEPWVLHANFGRKLLFG